MSGTSAAVMIGPTLGGWLYEAGGIRAPFLAVAGLAALSAAGFLWLHIPPPRAETETVPIGVVLRSPAVAVCAAVVIAASATMSMLEPVLPLFLAATLGIGPARVGLLFGSGAVASTILHPIYGRLTDRWGGRRLMMIGLLLMACMLPLLSITWSYRATMAFFVLNTMAMALVITPSLTYMAEAVSSSGAGSFGVGYGLYNMAWGAGLLGGPALSGFLYERIGFAPLTLVWAPMLVVVTWVLARVQFNIRLKPDSTENVRLTDSAKATSAKKPDTRDNSDDVRLTDSAKAAAVEKPDATKTSVRL
jgi:predicted MFS family arabinose efflux permease